MEIKLFIHRYFNYNVKKSEMSILILGLKLNLIVVIVPELKNNRFHSNEICRVGRIQ